MTTKDYIFSSSQFSIFAWCINYSTFYI